MTRRLVRGEEKRVEQLANMHPVGVPDRRAARHAARIALRRLVRTRKTRQKDHDPEHRNSACRQCTTDLERIAQVPGTGSASSHSIVITSALAMLTGEIYLRVDDPHMPRQRIVAAECLLLDAKRAADFLLACVVNCIFVSGEVVGPGEDGVAGLAGGGVNALTFVRTRLRAPLQERR